MRFIITVVSFHLCYASTTLLCKPSTSPMSLIHHLSTPHHHNHSLLPTNNPTKGLRNSYVSVQKLVRGPMRHILCHNHVFLLPRMERRCIVHGRGNDSQRPTPHRLSWAFGTLRFLHLRLHFLLQYGTLRAYSKTVATNAIPPTPIVIYVHTSRIGALAELTQDRTILAPNFTPKKRAHSQLFNAES